MFCETCVLGKTSKIKISKAVHRTSEKLDYVHSDLWGPSRTPSNADKRYFVTIIDVMTRRVWIYVLINKSDAFSVFKN